MLNMNASRIGSSQMFALPTTVASVKEGALCAGVYEDGILKAQACTGAAGELVLGFAASQVMDVADSPKVETVTVPASGPYTVTLAKTPLNPTTAVGVIRISAIAGPLAYNAAVGAGQFSIAGRVVTFNAADAGKVMKITYRYALTVAEAQMLYGQGIGDGAQSVINGTGIIRSASLLFTDQYDPTSDWASGGTVYTGPNGTITKTAGTTAIPGILVAQAPSAANGNFLGLFVNLGL